MQLGPVTSSLTIGASNPLHETGPVTPLVTAWPVPPSLTMGPSAFSVTMTTEASFPSSDRRASYPLTGHGASCLVSDQGGSYPGAGSLINDHPIRYPLMEDGPDYSFNDPRVRYPVSSSSSNKRAMSITSGVEQKAGPSHVGPQLGGSVAVPSRNGGDESARSGVELVAKSYTERGEEGKPGLTSKEREDILYRLAYIWRSIAKKHGGHFGDVVKPISGPLVTS